MPKATIYIRVENWKQWQAIVDKSDYVNVRLQRDKKPTDENRPSTATPSE